jgi:hypothetical protein
LCAVKDTLEDEDMSVLCPAVVAAALLLLLLSPPPPATPRRAWGPILWSAGSDAWSRVSEGTFASGKSGPAKEATEPVATTPGVAGAAALTSVPSTRSGFSWALLEPGADRPEDITQQKEEEQEAVG